MYDPICTIWEFETARFRVEMTAEIEWDLDLSFDDTGEVSEGLESGRLVAFCAKCAVYLDGREIGVDYLGNCIYKSFDAFRDHIGISEPAMRAKARRDLVAARGALKSRLTYQRGRYSAGTIGRARYMRETVNALQAAAQARHDAMHTLRNAGRCGSYFSDMVREAIRDARDTLRETPEMRAA